MALQGGIVEVPWEDGITGQIIEGLKDNDIMGRMAKAQPDDGAAGGGCSTLSQDNGTTVKMVAAIFIKLDLI